MTTPTGASQPLDLVPAVVAVVLDGEGRVCLVRDEKRDRWTLPMGRVDPGESVREAVVREVREEAGLVVTGPELTGVYTDPATQVFDTPDGRKQFLAHVFRCEWVDGDPEPDGDETTAVDFFAVGDYPNDLEPSDDWVVHALDGDGVEVT
ncbi:NUDIX domain-containing protein [Halobacterium jilantaiense]|uniref:ADP-ribose pyrophosphatase YjhB, NUDIX family n=1 Tax=Halobacterium jilantaiense TaxID=355548 RepID=A0A1I0Q347_9EURY|nr:NUDIX domain-containing protein [Halobacterium jilantaiense]SEW21294.1 ADP-ribose pyrophosphatase YjhB, NUDIX family [Halobacterium jilantaiense]